MNYYTPKVVIPMLRRIYPTLVNANDITPMGGGKTRTRVWDYEIDSLRGCGFLSKNRLKKLLKTWNPGKCSGNRWISINVVEYEGALPTWKTSQVFYIPEKRDDFIVELANLSDLHGIIKMSGNAMWVRKAENSDELNIDATTLNRISLRLGGGRL